MNEVLKDKQPIKEVALLFPEVVIPKLRSNTKV